MAGKSRTTAAAPHVSRTRTKLTTYAILAAFRHTWPSGNKLTDAIPFAFDVVTHTIRAETMREAMIAFLADGVADLDTDPRTWEDSDERQRLLAIAAVETLHFARADRVAIDTFPADTPDAALRRPDGAPLRWLRVRA